MFETNQEIKRFYYIVETLKIHGEITYGTDDIDVDALMNFLKNPSTKIKCLDCNTLEGVEEVLMQDILNGMPVWRFFHLPEWTKNILEKEWEDICKEEAARQEKQAAANKKKYLCLQDCYYFDFHDTSIGCFVKCTATNLGGDSFKYKRKCPHYLDKTKLTEQERRELRFSVGLRKRR